MRKLFFTLLLIIGTVTTAYSYTGEAGPPMLKLIYGSRAISLGGAYSGVASDVYYMDSNPAGGDPSGVFKVSLIHQEWIEDVNFEGIRLSRGITDQLYLGLGFTYLYLPFTYYDEYGYSNGTTYTISQCMGMLNAGYKFRDINLAIGANAKFFYNYVPQELYAGQSYFLFAADLGIISRTNILKTFIGPEPSLTTGLTVKNIGYSAFMEKLPTEVHLGISYRVLRNLLITGEAVFPFYEPISGSVGAEFDFAQTFFLQAGLQIVENPMLGVGFGYRNKDFNIYASYTPSMAFRNMMSVSVEFTFGQTKSLEIEKEIDRLMVKALDLFGEKKYEEALGNIERVLVLDSNNRRARLLKKVILNETNINGNGGTED
jgi:hypothetical protein